MNKPEFIKNARKRNFSLEKYGVIRTKKGGWIARCGGGCCDFDFQNIRELWDFVEFIE